MEQFTRTTTVENQGAERTEGKTLLANTPDVTVDDLGGEVLPLRENDDRDAMVAAVREEAAKSAHFAVTESSDEVVAETVESLKRQLSPEAAKRTLRTLKKRFDANSHLHEGCDWNRVKAALEANPEALWSISQMGAQGHKPNVYNFDNDGFDIGTCSKETPVGARNCVYDAEAAAWLKENLPQATFNGSAVEMAEAMGIRLMSPTQYKEVLQRKGKFDAQTCSWLLTDEATRKSNYKALNGDRYQSDVYVDKDDARNRREHRAWRGSLRVLWS